MKFREPVKGKGFRNLLRKRGYEVYLVDEFRTSCRCSSCGGETKTFRKCRNPRPWKRDDTITRRGLVMCTHCTNIWNRDYNASFNIHKICQSALKGLDRPDYLKGLEDLSVTLRRCFLRRKEDSPEFFHKPKFTSQKSLFAPISGGIINFQGRKIVKFQDPIRSMFVDS